MPFTVTFIPTLIYRVARALRCVAPLRLHWLHHICICILHFCHVRSLRSVPDPVLRWCRPVGQLIRSHVALLRSLPPLYVYICHRICGYIARTLPRALPTPLIWLPVTLILPRSFTLPTFTLLFTLPSIRVSFCTHRVYVYVGPRRAVTFLPLSPIISVHFTLCRTLH